MFFFNPREFRFAYVRREMAFLAKTCGRITIWLIRIFQNIFGLVLIGVTGYMLHEFNHYKFAAPHEVVVPLVFSCFAVFVSFWSLIAVCCLGYHLQVLAAFLDFVILAGYIASVALLAPNFHAHEDRNPLRNWLIYIRAQAGDSFREGRSGALVNLLCAGVVMMIIAFFFTTLLSVCVAELQAEKHNNNEYGGRGRDVEEVRVSSERRRRERRR